MNNTFECCTLTTSISKGPFSLLAGEMGRTKKTKQLMAVCYFTLVSYLSLLSYAQVVLHSYAQMQRPLEGVLKDKRSEPHGIHCCIF